MKSILVIAPHPDDETLGCAGTLLKHLNAGDEINFIFVTKISKNTKGYISRKKEIKVIKKKYNLKKYKLIPIGWSAGCYLALYFAQLYNKLCKYVILLDSALLTRNNMKFRLKMLYNNIKNIYPITDKNYKKLLDNWKNK